MENFTISVDFHRYRTEGIVCIGADILKGASKKTRTLKLEKQTKIF